MLKNDSNPVIYKISTIHAYTSTTYHTNQLSPISPTESPVSPTESPVTTPESPISPTESPVSPTESPVTTPESLNIPFSFLKNVRFNNTVKVILIPTIYEFRENKLDSIIWTSRKEFRDNLKEKIKMIISKYPHLSEREAYKQIHLYDEITEEATDTPRPGV